MQVVDSFPYVRALAMRTRHTDSSACRQRPLASARAPPSPSRLSARSSPRRPCAATCRRTRRPSACRALNACRRRHRARPRLHAAGIQHLRRETAAQSFPRHPHPHSPPVAAVPCTPPLLPPTSKAFTARSPPTSTSPSRPPASPPSPPAAAGSSSGADDDGRGTPLRAPPPTPPPPAAATARGLAPRRRAAARASTARGAAWTAACAPTRPRARLAEYRLVWPLATVSVAAWNCVWVRLRSDLRSSLIWSTLCASVHLILTSACSRERPMSCAMAVSSSGERSSQAPRAEELSSRF